MRILVIEDSDTLRTYLVEGLQAAGYAVDAVADGREGLIYARATQYDLIVLDIMLPQRDGLSLLNEYRAAHGHAPVIIISARDRVDQRVEGLRTGADDYLVKPFAFDELLARIEALTRRACGIRRNTIEIDGVTLDLAAKCFRIADAELPLPPREYAILEMLFMRAGSVISRMELEEHIYDADRQVWSNAIDSAIANIRRQLTQHGIDDLIKTKRGRGYCVPTPPSATEACACDR
jgi:DNA-binding response OmpR family regulator